MNLITTKLEIDDWFLSLKENISLWISDPPYPFDERNGAGRYQNMYKRLSWSQLYTVFDKMYDATSIRWPSLCIL